MGQQLYIGKGRKTSGNGAEGTGGLWWECRGESLGSILPMPCVCSLHESPAADLGNGAENEKDVQLHEHPFSQWTAQAECTTAVCSVHRALWRRPGSGTQVNTLLLTGTGGTGGTGGRLVFPTFSRAV